MADSADANDHEQKQVIIRSRPNTREQRLRAAEKKKWTEKDLSQKRQGIISFAICHDISSLSSTWPKENFNE